MVGGLITGLVLRYTYQRRKTREIPHEANLESETKADKERCIVFLMYDMKKTTQPLPCPRHFQQHFQERKTRRTG
jgi:hypothetical protein